MKRLCIYPKEAAQITGKTVGTCRRIFRTIRKLKGKEKGSLITIEEFSNHIGIDTKMVEELLNN